MATAKYVATNNNVDLNVDYRFGERIHGVVKSYKEPPSNYVKMQLKNENYKYGSGESRKEVAKRMKEA